MKELRINISDAAARLLAGHQDEFNASLSITKPGLAASFVLSGHKGLYDSVKDVESFYQKAFPQIELTLYGEDDLPFAAYHDIATLNVDTQAAEYHTRLQ